MGDYIYEVETRFYFDNNEDTFAQLPFLKSCLQRKILWNTTHYGKELHEKDIILRISHATIDNGEIFSLGYKEADTGKLLNVRKEYGEIITEGIKESVIMKILKGRVNMQSPEEVEEELIRLGYSPFMSFEGKSMVGKYEPLNMHFKLMYCKVLEYPLLLEIEKEAKTIDEIRGRADDLNKFIEEYRLEERIVRKEPPTLLYDLQK